MSVLGEAIAREWRELGVYYERDDVAREWLILGSRDGLRRFAGHLMRYARDPQKRAAGEHEHFGPPMYLKVATSAEPRVDRDSIRGPAAAIDRLGRLLEQRSRQASLGDRFRLDADLAPGAAYALVFVVKEDAFDPASADASIGGI